jgi:hypothetical protein
MIRTAEGSYRGRAAMVEAERVDDGTRVVVGVRGPNGPVFMAVIFPVGYKRDAMAEAGFMLEKCWIEAGRRST